jgi:hypothetical protein
MSDDYEQERKMRYVTSIERMGFENGMQQGMQQGKAWLLQQMLAVKFPNTDLSQYQDKLSNASEDTIARFAMQLLVANSIDEVFSTQH